MEKFKIDNFMAENEKYCFPEYYELPSCKCKEIVDAIAEKYNIKAGNPQEFVKLITLQQTSVETTNAESRTFDLKIVFEKLPIKPLEMIFINWHQFDRIDAMSFEDLAEYFDSIWYPAADDIDVFDSSFEWILSIDHAGFTKLLKSK